ncbi:DNA/RNA nuclease SfsA [Azoarcus indigens]|uniref:Sugar fermentation stimulation protein homolog n=1 Tax=Azoarcus indigens TaxID=29545 RepID=A0A4R6E3B3_9RHOO|nr:DNA/RNA nuclease SfsA [Azoarcus indigens]NMG66515.1 DNA/RNA nuclease SfsA [Azoarcus indigens]TDN51298.1 sugar fermentation stimulation protein [Azoarcus indigens]
MKLPPLVEGRLLRRYQRFFAEVELVDGSRVVAHCPNTGSMTGCAQIGAQVWLSAASNPLRKLAWTWELVEARPAVLVGVHTGRINALAREAIDAGLLPGLAGYQRCRAEVRYGVASRVDWLLESDGWPPTYVEVKSVTAVGEDGIGFFPDAVTSRGARHLAELSAMAAAGARAVLLFCAPRADLVAVRPADEIDPVYGRALRAALAAGVEVLAVSAQASPQALTPLHALPVRVG